MKVTIKDIARAAGVSHPTVSKALNGSPGVSQAVRQRILSIAEQMNYIPNQAARRLADKQTQTIGLLWPKSEALFFHHLSLQIQQEAARRGLDVMISLADPPRGLRAFNEHFVDRIIFWSPPGWQPDLAFIQQKELFHGRMLLIGGGALKGTHRISVDRSGAIYEAVRYLAANGHRRITFIGDSHEKQLGFTKGILEQRMEYHEHYVIAVKEGEPFPEQRVAALLDSLDKPTAFIVDNQSFAFGLLKLFRDRGLRMPDDYSLIVYDEIPEMQRLEIPVTTVGPPIGKLAALALSIIAGKEPQGQDDMADIEIKCELHVRKSTGRL
ncbi:LacI family DNA-binding transcriptional regulator [Paenibacillus whitsoniae]|uniref:LacI family transcriptional regulator n=1 Tax=Paenibacillus whitsoniae TaxID=2496558 RepID=A0A3S0CDX5_9BACL|nr:LacI family DNA-binding transcriptional regulator [Paenibacillus whitsoniae]RTE10539.1 LacI family transcriptional regulator [Paenibacillus whitsoniae]